MTVEERIENEFGQSAEEAIRELSEWVDHAGLTYGPDTIAQILGINLRTLYKLSKQYGIKLGRSNYSRLRDWCWVKWGYPLDEWLRQWRYAFSQDELAWLLNCPKKTLNSELSTHFRDTSYSYAMDSYYRGERKHELTKKGNGKWQL